MNNHNFLFTTHKKPTPFNGNTLRNSPAINHPRKIHQSMTLHKPKTSQSPNPPCRSRIQILSPAINHTHVNTSNFINTRRYYVFASLSLSLSPISRPSCICASSRNFSERKFHPSSRALDARQREREISRREEPCSCCRAVRVWLSPILFSRNFQVFPRDRGHSTCSPVRPSSVL